MSLPAFRYHPDPLATGSVIRSDARCVCAAMRAATSTPGLRKRRRHSS
ncbi:CbrC family protein [Burkholderia stabilis]